MTSKATQYKVADHLGVSMQTDWDKMKTHYLEGEEDSRLSGNSIEKLRTLDILSRFITKTAATILDVGGGSGVYAGPLAELGHNVYLIDPVELHIEQAKTLNEKIQNKIEDVRVGNALELPYEDGFADYVLYFGPLYHLIKREERQRAVLEAYRVLKSGGLFFAVGISRFASLMDLFLEDKYIKDPDVYSMIEHDLKNGQHRCPEGADCFTTAFFHHPDELRLEVSGAGFRDTQLLGIEGPVWNVQEVTNVLSDQVGRELRLNLLRTIESELSIVGASSHIMAIGRK